MTSYLVTLLLTIGIELAIVLFVRQFSSALKDQPILIACLCMNLLTHPLATLAYFALSLPFLPVEILVVVAEAVAYRYVGRIPWHWSIALAVLANGASMSVGLVAS